MDSYIENMLGGAGLVVLLIYVVLVLVMLVLTIVALVAVIKIPKEIQKLSNNVSKLCFIVGQNNKNLGRPDNEQTGYNSQSPGSGVYNYPGQ